MTTMNQSGARMSRDKDSSHNEFEDLKRLIHGKLVDKLDLSRLGDLQGDTLRREIRLVVEHCR
jgi:pilus assembly protein CpaF